jgi:hypothetical protein
MVTVSLRRAEITLRAISTVIGMNAEEKLPQSGNGSRPRKINRSKKDQKRDQIGTDAWIAARAHHFGNFRGQRKARRHLDLRSKELILAVAPYIVSLFATWQYIPKGVDQIFGP